MPSLRFPLVAALCLMAGTATAQDYQPYPTPQITQEQWARYGESVRQMHGDSLEIFKDKQLIAFADLDNRTFWLFTMKNHPAHPAWITRQMYEEGGAVRVRQIGYFAGKEEEFAKLFAEYLKRNEELKKDVARRNR